MRSDVIVIASIGSQDPAQMRLAQDDEMIHTLAPHRSDQPFGKAILPGRAWGRRSVPDAHGANSAHDDGAIDSIPIADEVARRLIRRIEPFFPLSHGVPRVDDRRVISGIVFVIRNGLRWRDAPREYGPHKTVYNRFVRWSRLGVFNKIFAELARKAGKPRRLMIDSTHLKAHRTAASLLKKGLFPDVLGAPRAA